MSHDLVINEQAERTEVELEKMFRNLNALKEINVKDLNNMRVRLLQKINIANEMAIALMYRISFELLPGSI